MYTLEYFLKKDFNFVFLDKGEGRETERERNINVWLPLVHPIQGTWPETQACALTRNRTGTQSTEPHQAGGLTF